MANIKAADVLKWDAMCKNGFRFDVRYWMIHNEKTVSKIVETDDGHIQIHLLWMDDYETKTNEYGCSWKVPTGKKIPVANVSFWRPTGSMGVFSSMGIGKWIPIGDPVARKSFKTLIDATATIDIDAMTEIGMKERFASGRIA